MYNDTEWVSYLKPETYRGRVAFMDALNFAGTSDWAIDLNGTISDTTGPDATDDDDEDEDDEDADDFQPCDYTLTFASLDDLNAQAGGLRTDCVSIYAMQVLMDMLQTAYDNYTDVNNGYDDMFGYYVTYMKKLVPQVAADAFMFNLSVTGPGATMPYLGFGMDCEFAGPKIGFLGSADINFPTDFDCVGGEHADKHFACSDLNLTT